MEYSRNRALPDPLIKRTVMKKSTLVFLLAFSAFITHSWAQEYDDVYFDPSIDERYTGNDANDDRWNDDAYTDNAGYVTEDINQYGNYGSRIRRFNRPSTSFGYYSGCYVDRYNYYGFQPGTSVYVVNNRWNNSPWGFNDFNRWNAWNTPYAYNPYAGWNAWNNPYAYNPYGWNNGWSSWNSWNNPYNPYNPYGWNNGWGTGWNNGWNGGWAGNPVDNNNGRSTYYGPRGGMSSNASGSSPRQLARKRRAVAGSDTPQRSLRDVNNGRTMDESNGRVSRSSAGSVSRNAESNYSPRTSQPSRTMPSRTQPSRSSYENSNPSRGSSGYGRSSSSSSPSRSSGGSYNRSSSPSSSSGYSRSSSPSRSSGASRSSSSSSSRSSGSSSRSSSGSRRGGGK